MSFRTRLSAAAFLVILPAWPQTIPDSSPKPPAAAPNREWPAYGGNPEGTRYSPLKQIDRSNVGRLRVAWTYETPGSGLQTNPIVVHGVLYGNTPGGHVIALDGATGKLLW
jgi:quinoprotein glucose dehydrogenase